MSVKFMVSVLDFSYLWSTLKVSVKTLQDANTWIEPPFDEELGALHPEALQVADAGTRMAIMPSDLLPLQPP